MKTHDNGGPAFPSLRENNNPAMPLIAGAEGLTMHDYFMAHAPITLQDAINAMGAQNVFPRSIDNTMAQLAKMRGIYATAMIAEKRKIEEERRTP